jgi:hypothetical protein
MEQPRTSSAARFTAGVAESSARNEAQASGVSWAAVMAGAFVSAAVSLALLALGTGIGFSAVSPWPNVGASASTVGWTAVVWLVLMQIIASSIAGYLAGRLRSRWVSVHTHEVYFRDTAHGFLVWAVGLVMTAAFLTSAAASMVGGVAGAGSTAAAISGPSQSREAAVSEGWKGSEGYVADTLVRTSRESANTNTAALRAEVELILANGLREGSLPPADRSYLAQVVSAQTGTSQSDAEKRVDVAFAGLQQGADTARKAFAHSMYWTFLALLVGAFCASLAATLGGRERDRAMVI